MKYPFKPLSMFAQETSSCLHQQPEVDFYIAPNGSDSWSGKLPVPCGNDGPFRTLQRARDAVRELKHRKRNDIRVQIRGGIYRLEETVVFTVEDSGEGAQKIIYEAYPDEIPVFTSDREITGWHKTSDDLPGLPAEARGHVYEAETQGHFYTLYDNQGRLRRARSKGFIPLEGGTHETLHFPNGWLKAWPNLEDVEIVIHPYHAWILNILPLVTVDEEAAVARVRYPATYPMNELRYLRDTPSCWVENALEYLDEPGKWVLDSRRRKVYLWPRDGKKPEHVYAPSLIEYIRVEGLNDLHNGGDDIPVRNLCFRGLCFKHGDSYRVSEADAGLQHDWNFLDKATALFHLRGARDIVIEGCRFMDSGGDGLRADLYAQSIHIRNNRFEHLGGLGILLCGYGAGTK
ncbi:MAG: right-handed parallel beta-helix repeat-containing protein, partial [Lentisphaerae bacterium]